VHFSYIDFPPPPLFKFIWTIHLCFQKFLVSNIKNLKFIFTMVRFTNGRNWIVLIWGLILEVNICFDIGFIS
jgi:hypothetical protein